MEDYKVSDYGIFNDAISTTKAFNDKITAIQSDMNTCKSKLNDESVFMGPICESCVQGFGTVDGALSTLVSNFGTISTYLNDTATAYVNGDTEAMKTVLKLTNGQVSTGVGANKGTPVSTCEIPSDLDQAGYTVTCYGEGGWYLGGGSTPTAVADGTAQKSVHEAWLADGGRYKDGIAVMNVDGTDHYLIATANALGNVGDNVTVNFQNGESIPCVIADAKSSGDSNYTTYGHAHGNSVNVLEFEVDRNVYNSNGNPNTSGWGLEWDSSSNVSSVDNYGTVI